MERHVAIIPCRKGSKSIKDKNLLKLGDKTLVQLAMDCAYNSKLFDKIVVTSDYKKYDLNIDKYANTPFTKVEYIYRMPELCTDDALMADVVVNALESISGVYQWVWLFQPTSPLRTIQDIKNIMNILKTQNVNTVISYKPPKDHPHRMYTINNRGQAYKYGKETDYKNKEDLSKDVFIRSGNFYVTKYKNFFDKKSFENPPVYSYIMGNFSPVDISPEQMRKSYIFGLNIDSKDDYLMAKEWLRSGEIRL